MSPDKLRAVISLYHAADSFITPENLEDRIDKAFVWNQDVGRRREIDLPQIIKNAEGGSGPRLGKATARTSWGRVNRSLAGLITDSWSGDSRATERGTRTAAALLGVDPSGKPGLETVQEEGERVQEWITYHAEDFKATARKGLPVSTDEDSKYIQFIHRQALTAIQNIILDIKDNT
jgi:hypothetical protein